MFSDCFFKLSWIYVFFTYIRSGIYWFCLVLTFFFWDGRYDPAFVASSSLYDGKLKSENFYSKDEFNTATVPYAFFPHKYNPDAIDKDVDGVINTTEAAEAVTALYPHSYTVSAKKFPSKDSASINNGNDDIFKLFFDERLTRSQAFKMITAAQVYTRIYIYSCVHVGNYVST